MDRARRALFVLVLVVIRDHRLLQRATYTIGGIGLLFLLLPLVPGLGATINGSDLWIRFAGLSFQPGELAKLALIIFFAGYLVRASATRSRWPASGSSASTCRGRVTSGRSCWPGWPASAC